jgi:hypothetical protein
MNESSLSFLLKSDNGNELSGKQTTYSLPGDSKNQRIASIKSGYYLMGDDFELILDELNLLPKSKTEVSFDVKKRELYDSEGILKNAFVPEENNSLYAEIYSICKTENSTPIIVNSDYNNNHNISTFSLSEDYPSVEESRNSITSCTTEIGVSNESVLFVSIPNEIIEADEDGIIHLERNFAKYYLHPNIKIDVK